LILAKYVFLIFGSDINESRRHIHVTYTQRGFKRACKFWLEPSVELDKNKKGNFSSRELLEIEKLILENRQILLNQLEIFYSRKKVTAIRK
jgi:Domain of unknown function (DUF4160)